MWHLCLWTVFWKPRQSLWRFTVIQVNVIQGELKQGQPHLVVQRGTVMTRLCTSTDLHFNFTSFYHPSVSALGLARNWDCNCYFNFFQCSYFNCPLNCFNSLFLFSRCLWSKLILTRPRRDWVLSLNKYSLKMPNSSSAFADCYTICEYILSSHT